ncbi:MAG: HAMP domain-containing protein [Rhizobacter sp.]|nr:HAMP domain-containing protein [Bacteriovorax sp.]
MQSNNTVPFIKKPFSFWKNISISKKLYAVVGTMAMLVIIELLTLRFATDTLSAVRAFVGGEASWSKAQKNAVYRFQRYAMTKNEADYEAFHESLKIPDGDRKARTELSKAKPNMSIVYEGFIEGHVHADDIESVVNLLRRFYWVSYIMKAVDAWTEGDKLLLELREVAIQYHDRVTRGDKDSQRMQESLDQIIGINNGLTRVEGTFSEVLGAGSRWLEDIVFAILFFLVITVESIGLTLTFFTSRAISKGLNSLNEVATEFGRGDFTRRLPVHSGDEIGKLTKSVNSMGDLLQKSYYDLRLSHKELEDKIQIRTAELAEIANQNSMLYQEAKNAVKMRDDFLSIASHELRTPLTALNLQLYLLEKAASSQEKEGSVEQVKDLSKKASTLVKKIAVLQEVLMDLAQIRAGKLEVKKRPNDVSVIALEVVSHLISESQKLGSEIIFDTKGSIIGVFDSTRIGQVITNLLTNALKYGDKKPIQLNLYEDNGMAVIEVIDHGIGISSDKQRQIFERFERVNEDPAVSGLGLGLYISKQIIEAHSGVIEIESSPETGTKFTAKFPIA